MLTGIGGGMTRDLLLTETPQVLRSDLYAVAALAGASIVVGSNLLGFLMASQLWPEEFVLRPSLHGDQIRLASACRAALRAAAPSKRIHRMTSESGELLATHARN